MIVSESKTFNFIKIIFVLLSIVGIFIDILYFDKLPRYTIIILVIVTLYYAVVKNLR